MQIVRSGKVSRLHDLLVIRGKTFVIVQQFETSYNRKKKIRWKTFAIRGLSAKTAKVFHRERFALYGSLSVLMQAGWEFNCKGC